jgi:hypothetical protein
MGDTGFGAIIPAQSLNPSGDQRQFLAPNALHLAHQVVGIEFGCGEELVAGPFNRLFHSQPAEQRAQCLTLAGIDFEETPEMGPP